MVTTKRTTRNPELAPGLRVFSKSAMSHKRNLYKKVGKKTEKKKTEEPTSVKKQVRRYSSIDMQEKPLRSYQSLKKRHKNNRMDVLTKSTFNFFPFHSSSSTLPCALPKYCSNAFVTIITGTLQSFEHFCLEYTDWWI